MLKKDSHLQIHTGECVDRPGGGSGGQDQLSTEFSGGASIQAQLHRGDATAGTTLQRPQIKKSYRLLDNPKCLLLLLSYVHCVLLKCQGLRLCNFKSDYYCGLIFSHKLQNVTCDEFCFLERNSSVSVCKIPWEQKIFRMLRLIPRLGLNAVFQFYARPDWSVWAGDYSTVSHAPNLSCERKREREKKTEASWKRWRLGKEKE